MDARDLEKELKKDGEIFIEKFQELSETVGDKTFFYYGEEDKRYSFAEFNRLANSVAHNLRAMGVGKGDRVSLFLMNPLVTTLAMFGIWKIGAVFCPINFNYKGKLLAYQINDTDPKILVVGQNLVPLMNHIAADVKDLQVVLHRPRKGDHDYLAETAEEKPDDKFPCAFFDDLLKGETANPDVFIEYRDTASIIYTSGTTGNPKGVVQSHRWLHNYVFVALRFMHPDEVVYNDLPLYHVAGAFQNIVKAAWAGCMVAVWDQFSPKEFWNRIKIGGATSAILLDIMVPWLMADEETPEDRMNTLKLVHMQPLPQNHHAVARRFGIDAVTVGYGSTEAGNGFVGVIDEWGDEQGTPKELFKGLPKEEFKIAAREFGLPIVSGTEEIKKGFMGKPSILLEAAVLNESDEQLGPGDHGQLAFRSKLPYLMLNEYFKKPEETVKSTRNGWFHSGDIVYRDQQGIFYFVDRIGGFIRIKGENMSSSQVEDLINGHPQINVSTVFPIHAEEGDEEDIVIYIVLQPGEELTESELRTWIEAEMPKFMWPKYIRIADELPVTPTFKVEKYKLKARIMDELGTRNSS